MTTAGCIHDFDSYFEAQLRKDVSDAHIDYSAVWDRLCRRIDNAEALGPLAVLKQHEDPGDERWEAVEQALARRIREHQEYEEPVDDCIADTRVPDAARMAQTESALMARIDQLEQLPAWQQELGAERILPHGQWERIEDGLMKRIERHERITRYSWPAASFWRTSLARIAAALVIAVGAGAGGLFIYRQTRTPLPTWVYQAQGADIGLVGTADPYRKSFASSRGGAMRIVNKHGYVQLQNGAALQLEKVSESGARYCLDIGRTQGRDIEGGTAIFFVEKNEKRRRFEVVTAEYRIEVTGTYFRVLPDLNKRATTEVLEGSLVVHGDTFGTLRLGAGQSIVYDYGSGRYVVRSGGPVVARRDVEDRPDVESIKTFRILSVNADVALCEVSIDGRYRGPTPLHVLLAEGEHEIRITREEHVVLDTLVAMRADAMQTIYARTRDDTAGKAVAELQRSAPRSGKPSAHLPVARHTETPPMPVGKQGRLFAQAQAAESSDWRNAVTLYQKLFNDPSASTLLKQTALFSIGKLQAEHLRDRAASKESFLRYIALYPSGTFVRESLLRLAELEFETNPDKAIEYYQTYFERFPNHYRISELQYRVGLIYLQQNRYSEAEYMFKQSLSSMLYNDESMRRRIYGGLYRAMVGRGDLAHAESIKERHLDTLQ